MQPRSNAYHVIFENSRNDETKQMTGNRTYPHTLQTKALFSKKIIIILNEMAFLWKENTSCNNISINFLCLPEMNIVMITKHPQQSSTGISQNVPWYILLSKTGHLLVSDVCVSVYRSRPHATVHAYMYMLITMHIF